MQLNLNEAINRMREFTEAGVPFSFSFYTYSTTNRFGGELREVRRAILRKGYRDSQSNRKTLIAYEDLEMNQNRQFHLPLLVSINGQRVS